MFSKEVYVNRRNALKAKMNSGVLLFLGTSEAAVNYPGNTYRYRQDSNFNYFFGLTDPDLAAIIDLESGEEIIFGNDVDIDDIIWMGPQPFIKDKAESVGVSKSFPFAELEKYAKENSVPISQPEAIRLTEILLKIKRPEKILEIGTAIGYSAILMANANSFCEITTIERDEKRYLEAVKNIKKFNLEDRITLLFNDAPSLTNIPSV